MSKPVFKTVILFTLITLIGACGSAATDVSPTATLVPATATRIALEPTQTPLLPTATPVLTMMSTISPSTAAPTPAMVPTITTPSPTPTPQVEPTGSNGTPFTLDTVARVECLRKLEGHNNGLYGLAFSPDGQFLGSYSLDGVVQLWDPASWQVIREYTASSVWGWRLFFLADNAHISSGNGTVWDIASGQLEHALNGEHHVTFSPDGVWMAANGRGKLTIELWRVEDWDLERDIVTSHAGDIFTMAFSPDSQMLASAANSLPNTPGFSVKLWDVLTGQELFTLQGHQDAIHGLAFSPDGKWLASASMDTTVKVWDVQTGQLLHTLQTRAELFDVTFSPDSTLVAAALNNNTVELWDVASGRLARTLNHGGEVVSVAFSPDGALLASGAYDSKVYLWGIP
jgi:WD40 repeat protein